MTKGVSDLIDLAKETFGDETIGSETIIGTIETYDSMGMVQFMIDIETNFEVELKEDTIDNTMTINEIWSIIEQQEA